MTPLDLEGLAARVEGHSPTGRHDLDLDRNRHLNESIAAAIGMPLMIKLGDPALGNDRMVPNRVPAFATSLDAAMTLVPKGWDWSAGTAGYGQLGHAFLRPAQAMTAPGISINVDAATPALALTTAALRARALQTEQS